MSTPKPLPSKFRLHQLLTYDPVTGHLFWKERLAKEFARSAAAMGWNKHHAGQRAGSDHSSGYRKIKIDGVIYLEHRIIVMWMKGSVLRMVDHVRGVGEGNRYSNLRDNADEIINGRNRKNESRNISGVPGVTWIPANRKWRAAIGGRKTLEHLGHFDTVDEAIAARRAAEVRHGYHPNHGRAA